MFIRFKLGRIATFVIGLTLFMGAYTYIPAFRIFFQNGFMALVDSSSILQSVMEVIN